MCKLLYMLTISVFVSSSALAEMKQIKLLNPDGSPAIQAKAIAISKLSFVDNNLRELPFLSQAATDTGTSPLIIEGGTLRFDSSAKALIAQSEDGFAFIPLPTRSNEVKLRPWAKLKFDSSKLNREAVKGYRPFVLWQNCFTGNAPRPHSAAGQAQNDPFGSDPFAGDPFAGDPFPQFDWRFDPIVTWMTSFENAESDTLKVPPGEVMVVMSREDLLAGIGDRMSTQLGSLRTYSDQLSTFVLPELGTIKGKLASDGGLPNWIDSGDSGTIVVAQSTVPIPDEIGKLVKLHVVNLTSKDILDQLSQRYASAAGTQYRQAHSRGGAARVNADGTFEMTNVPVGSYELSINYPRHKMTDLKQLGDAANKSVAVELTSKTLTCDVGELEPISEPVKFFVPKPQESQVETPKPVDANGNAGESIEAAEERIRQALAKQVDDLDFQGVSLRAVIEQLSTQVDVPIQFHEQRLEEIKNSPDQTVSIVLPRMTLQSALRNILSRISDDLAYTIRDEVLLITSKKDAAQEQPVAKPQTRSMAEPLSGEEFLQHWRTTAGTKSDGESLRRALKAHLESEFDAKQQARQAELARLRDLLKQSEEWLSNRQSQRDEIVKKKMEELLRP